MVSIEPSTKGIIQIVQGSKKISLGFCRLTVHYNFCNVHIKSSIATYKVYNHLYNFTLFIFINLCDNSSGYQVMDKTPGNKLLLGVLALYSLKPASKLCSNLPNQNTLDFTATARHQVRIIRSIELITYQPVFFNSLLIIIRFTFRLVRQTKHVPALLSRSFVRFEPNSHSFPTTVDHSRAFFDSERRAGR